MSEMLHPSGKPSGFQYDKQMPPYRANNGIHNQVNSNEEMEDDLIIEENTVYEIDRECFERLKRQKKRK
ncbi:MAG: hypothetical protein K0R46_2045 [Herbinix sp.]|jgi:hypothetical protein|nr:hypothetical protein [Herbinix sp.]